MGYRMQLAESIKRQIQNIDRQLGRNSWYRIGRNSIVVFNRRDGQRKAAAITYFAVFSIFPFILLMIVLFSFFIDSVEAQERVIGFISEFLPQGATGVQNLIVSVVDARGVAAGLGILLLLWGALGWFESIDRAVNEMWVAQGTRSFIKGKLFALSMIAALGFVMVLSWLADIAIGVAMSFATNVFSTIFVLWEVIVAFVTFALMLLV
ncbi:MAG: YihY/virulence factor BrkB family protein, partial [Chloroflexota bacterium]